MATPIKNLQIAIWTHLNAQPEYTALVTDATYPLKEFRFYDGNLFPFDWESGGVPDQKLPAHFARIIDGGREQVEDITGFYRFKVQLRNTFLFRASEGDSTLAMNLVDNAMEAVRLALDERVRRNQLLALIGGGAIEWTPRGGPGVGRDPKGGEPRFWGWVWEIEIFAPGFHI